ncbi:unnamed protein product [[Actinomadura] parvosata subsp. kistnae]|uniref:Uncharacterized protein n=1 Tax=[Actinomadura] parvosata subsp. kistnae TaxID=1909395 RepID=A0A1V0AGZ3_9ACTN|nr:hypothetical protein [Nonomuraea sp. ATCC 55076]AQZ69465.1 hypothetical protein BKM31_55475 [Nonomuraea sp. ATCC 55076]SPL91885.1 unnamed protein product [Actinomadura parvosata subsp. kistnae]
MAKKRKGKASPTRGVSGNPARRAQQLAAARPPAPDAGSGLFESLLGTAGDQWWPGSHRAIIERLAGLPAGSPLRLENAVVDLVGEEMWARTQAETMGFHWDQYLASLADLVRDRIRRAARTGGQVDDLWRLLHGLAAMTPPSSGEMLRRDPDPAVRAAVEDSTAALAEAGVGPGWPGEVLRAAPAGEPLLLTDVYGSRHALVAPFAWGGEDPHWYCWDVDRCTGDRVVHAAVFASPEEAFAEWRAAVGVRAAPASTRPAPCDRATVRDLLDPLCRADLLSVLMIGTESRQLVAEHFRQRQRARALCEPFTVAPEAGQDLVPIIDDFAAWLRERNGPRPEREDVATLADNWSDLSGPGYYACSPHRIEHTVILVADGYAEEYAEAALDLLPEWVEWCIERTGLADEPAERARQAAANNRWHGSDTMDLRRSE